MHNANKITIAVTGPSGFIGSHFIAYVSHSSDLEVRILLHNDAITDHRYTDFATFKGDLLDALSLEEFPVKGCTVINLVYLGKRSTEDNLAAIDNLAAVCARAGIKRFIHCSTAVVAGSVNSRIISENIIPRPTNNYELTKMAIETLLLTKYTDFFEVIILRPTAVFGPGGRNLIKQANYIRNGNRVLNYIRSCLYGYRHMNIVAIENVIAALKFLVYLKRPGLKNEVFIISDDDDELNKYRTMEKFLMNCFDIQDYRIPRIFIPSFVLKILLRLSGRTNPDPFTCYTSEKLLGSGFMKKINLRDSLKNFADWYLTNYSGNV